MTFIRSRIRSPEKAENLLREIFISALARLDTIEPVINLAGCLYRSARNKVINW